MLKGIFTSMLVFCVFLVFISETVSHPVTKQAGDRSINNNITIRKRHRTQRLEVLGVPLCKAFLPCGHQGLVSSRLEDTNKRGDRAFLWNNVVPAVTRHGVFVCHDVNNAETKRKGESIWSSQLNKYFLQVYTFQELAGSRRVCLSLWGILQKENLFHGVFCKVEFTTVRALLLKKSNRRCLCHEDICNL